ETLREGARVERNDEKRNPTDFALWKFSQKPGARQQEWDSPWGVGFPGWHLECSVMSSMGLGEQLDIHCGGVDHINVHHTNEIAQYEAAYGKQFFNYWMHGAFLNIAGGKKMAKSENNFLTLENVFVKKGIDPLAFRFAALQTHYRKPMEYSGEIIKNAEKGLKHLLNQTMDLQIAYSGTVSIDKKFNDKFTKAINDDLNMPQALSITQELLKSDLSDDKKYYTVLWFDRILGVITEWINIKQKESENLPKNIKEKKEERAVARKRKNWEESDRLRDELEKSGYIVEDIKNNKQRIYKK
ncbi:MAG: cysteine--tRNA ligase, partial [Patescibacteria group bacterium]|nr:cysteine--tRNA ligase [Patescibacteria group bacterium]